MPKQKAIYGQRAADSQFGFAKPVFQPSTTVLPTSPVLQAKLKTGEANDEFEQEADRVADGVTRMSGPRRIDDPEMAPHDHHAPQRVSRAAISQRAAHTPLPRHDAPPIVQEVLRSSGEPLDAATRASMEQRLRQDFSQVRVHTDAKARESAQSVNASAYTLGNHIVFGNGQSESGVNNGLWTLAHELAHVVQQARGGPSPPPLNGGILEQAADAAASAFAAGRPSINVAGASAPGLARQPQFSGPTLKVNREPRSFRESLNPEKLEYVELVDEIERIQEWLADNPSAPESAHLRSELKAFHAVELRLIEQREAEGLGPKEGSAAKLISIVHKGRLEKELGLWPDHKFLTKGIMEWRLEPPETFSQYGSSGWKKRRIQVKFTPHWSVGNKTVTFLQTVVQTEAESTPSKQPRIDIRDIDYSPFYGMDWDPKSKKWMPESALAPEGYKSSAPSSATDRSAYLFDEPDAPPGQAKRFETVAVVPETSATLGALTWSVGEGAGRVECTDAPSPNFRAALERFYAAPKDVGLDPEREERYDVILDGFIANDATLTAGQEKQLAPIITQVNNNPKWMVSVAGFADAMDKDPVAISEQRAQAVVSYLTGKGVPKEDLKPTGLGATWARYQPSMKEGRNRRVQVRLFYPDQK